MSEMDRLKLRALSIAQRFESEVIGDVVEGEEGGRERYHIISILLATGRGKGRLIGEY
jgi:hypothetical protein